MMTVELDHLFILTSVDAPAGDRLTAFGLTEGTRNLHPGQGTANRRFFFHNFMVELLWVNNSAEAQSEVIAPTHLWERWGDRSQGACPFGVCLRPTANLKDGSTPSSPCDLLPFVSWEYRPPYLPASLRCAVAENVSVLTEPMLFYISFGQRPDRYPSDRSQPLQHAVDLREVTRVELVSPDANHPSSALQAMKDTNLMRLRHGTDYLIELGFDGELQGKKADFRPELPLVLSW